MVGPAAAPPTQAMPEPRLVAALGDCALGLRRASATAAEHRRAQADARACRSTLRIPGCPPRPDRDLGLNPSKIIAVHLNYESRAAQRGRVPAAPSYFLKPPSSLAGDGDPIVRPQGIELLTFEGEVALIIGRAARGVSPEQARSRTSAGMRRANDVGVHDMRWNDRGSNVLSKGHDGFTPLGPRVPAADVDPAAIRLRTLVNGEVEQDDSTANLTLPVRRS